MRDWLHLDGSRGGAQGSGVPTASPPFLCPLAHLFGTCLLPTHIMLTVPPSHTMKASQLPGQNHSNFSCPMVKVCIFSLLPRALSVILNTVPDLPVGLQETLSFLMHEMGKPYCTPQENGMNEEDPDCTCWSNRSLGLKSSSSLAPALCWVWLLLLAFLPMQSARLGVS